MQPLLTDPTERLGVLLVCGGLLAMTVSLLCTPVAGRLAQRAGAVAIPRGRDIHEHPVPRWGGLAILLGFLVAVGFFVASCLLVLKGAPIARPSLVQGAGIVLGGLLISIVGALDDQRDLRPVPRLAGQVAASLIAYRAGVRIDLLQLPLLPPINTHWLAAPITVFWMLLIMNSINWIDGLDGLAGGICFIIAMFLAIVAVSSHQVCLALLCVALAGSTLGFLRYNYSPARIYMGGGSEFLGFVLASVSIVGAFKQVTTVAIVLPLIAMGVPILDSLLVVARRAASHAPVYQADRRHFHHALVDKGLSKEQAVLVLYAITLTLCIGAWTLFRHAPPPRFSSRHHTHVRRHTAVSPETAAPPHVSALSAPSPVLIPATQRH